MSRPARTVALPLLAGALLLAGCGGEESAVRDGLRAYAEAARDRNGREACERIVGFEQVVPPQLARGDGARRLCEQGIGQQGLADADRVLSQVEDAEVAVRGDTATATVGGEEIPMRRADGEWKLDAAAVARRSPPAGGAAPGPGTTTRPRSTPTAPQAPATPRQTPPTAP